MPNPICGKVFPSKLAIAPSKIPYRPQDTLRPYFALIIRAIGVLEGIALVGDPDFAIIDEVRARDTRAATSTLSTPQPRNPNQDASLKLQGFTTLNPKRSLSSQTLSKTKTEARPSPYRATQSSVLISSNSSHDDPCSPLETTLH